LTAADKVKQMKNQLQPLFVGAVFSLSALGVVCFCTALLACCGCTTGSADNDAGITGDIGSSCFIGDCTLPWCKDNNQVHCASGECVGPLADTYCTMDCELTSNCPEGFFCSVGCQQKVFKTSVCIREQDLVLLQDIGYCPK
jgi:hypothetical protein